MVDISLKPKRMDDPLPRPAQARGSMGTLSPTLRAVALASRTFDRLAPALCTRVMLHHFLNPRSRHRYNYRPMLPEGAQRLRLRHRGLDLTGWRWGRQGPAVLLVHGWEDHSGSMLGLVTPLRARGYQVFTLDAPGHGLSPNAATHLLDWSNALELMTRNHGPFESVVAHSFGATAAGVMLSRAPALRPKRMVMVSPMRDMEQHLEVFADIAALSVERIERLRQRLVQYIGQPLHELSAFNAATQFRFSGLVIHDRNDPVIPYATGAEIANRWQGARLCTTANFGHRRVLKSERVLQEIAAAHDTESP